MMLRGRLWGCAAAAVFLGLAGCKNNNLFGGLHDGGSGDATGLVEEGNAALSEGDYAKADDYYANALSKSPDNSQALYGQAAAAMGLAGLNIGQLVTNLTENKSAGASLRAEVDTARIVDVASTLHPDSLLYRIDVDKLDTALTTVIGNLEKIRLGWGDGKVSPTSPSLLINLGVARLLKAVTLPLKSGNGLLDIRETGGNYSVVELIPASTYDDIDKCDVVIKSVNNVAWGYLYLSDAATRLNIVTGTTLTDIKADMDSLFTEYRGKVDPPCVDVPDTLPSTRPTSPSDGI